MKKLLLLFIISTLLISLVQATTYSSGDTVNVYTIQKCYGKVTVKVMADSKERTYDIPRCVNTKDEIWECSCLSDYTAIDIKTIDNTITDKYYVALQYYIGPKQTEDDKRLLSFNNLYFEATERSSKPIQINGGAITVIIIIVVLLLLIGGAGYYAYKKIFKDEKYQI